MGACQHCGSEHEADTQLCPRTGEAMTAAGLCGGQVDRYQVLSLLGGGGCGAVYRAQHARTGAWVALKVLNKALMTDGAMLERFMREARAAAMVGDERIVRVLDAEVMPGGLAFIAMELLEGDDLKQLHRRERPLHPARLIGIICQVLEGLSAAHAKDVIHRDMKPANVFVVRREDAYGKHHETAKVLDFGISKMQGAEHKPLTVVGATLGTPAYMAYEQFFDARDVDARTDVYAVAAMLYELLSGMKAFDADSYVGLLEKVRIGDFKPLRSIAPALPVPLVAVVEKGLAKKRERRWQSAREFAVALKGTLQLLGDPPELGPRVVYEEPEEDPELLIRTAVAPTRSA
jgi:serine/threonine-protein kinase